MAKFYTHAITKLSHNFLGKNLNLKCYLCRHFCMSCYNAYKQTLQTIIWGTGFQCCSAVLSSTLSSVVTLYLMLLMVLNRNQKKGALNKPNKSKNKHKQQQNKLVLQRVAGTAGNTSFDIGSFTIARTFSD